MIPLRTALIAYAGLAVFALLTVRGRLLILALIVLAAATLKTVLHHYREKMTGSGANGPAVSAQDFDQHPSNPS